MRVTARLDGGTTDTSTLPAGPESMRDGFTFKEGRAKRKPPKRRY